MQIDEFGVDEDANLSDIRDAVRAAKEQDIPEFSDVKISANKDELVEQVNEALDSYLRRITDASEIDPLPSEIDPRTSESFVIEGASGETVMEDDGSLESGNVSVTDEDKDEPQDSVDGGDASASDEAEQEDSEEEDSGEEGSEDAPGAVKDEPISRRTSTPISGTR